MDMIWQNGTYTSVHGTYMYVQGHAYACGSSPTEQPPSTPKSDPLTDHPGAACHVQTATATCLKGGTRTTHSALGFVTV
jgi:hypothetical protein